MKIDILFLDTSIWEANNFLESNRIKQLIKLSNDGNVKLILPQLTFDEILNRLRKNAKAAVSKVKKHRNDTRVLRNIPKLISKFELLDEESITKELISIFKENAEKLNIELIDYTEMDIAPIFHAYFNKEFPFGTQGKKDEFPDAFALKIVENWAEENDEQVITFANDKDILNYDSEFLTINESFDKYLSEKLKAISETNIQYLEEAISDNHKDLTSEVIDWVNDKLDDYSKYYDVSNFMEVHDIEVINVDVDLGEYEITLLEDNYIFIQIEADIEFEVDVNMDDENYMMKDEDTKSWFSYETRIETIKRKQTVQIDMKYEPVPIDEGPGFIEILKINEDKDLKI